MGFVRGLSFVAALSFSTVSGATQPADCSRIAAGHEDYLRAVALYRRGDTSEAIEKVVALTPDTIERAANQLRRLPTDICVQAAVVLHSEAAMQSARDLHWRRSTIHFDAARRLLEKLPRAFRRDWLLAVGWFHQDLIFAANPELGFGEAKRHFDEAVEAFPRDAEVLLSAAALYEWSGSLRFGDAGHLKKAQDLYRKAVSLEPDVAEAWVRYGRTLEKRERFEEAEVALRRAHDLATEDNLIYRIRMALGRLAQRAGRRGDAAAHYGAAIELNPGWQVGYIALSHCLHVMGKRSESREVLDHIYTVPETDDNLFGWWSYEVGLSPRLEPLLRTMRREVQK